MHSVDVSYRGGRLTARPAAAASPGATGLAPLEIEHGRDTWVYVPEASAPAEGVPLVVLIHAPNEHARRIVDMIVPHARALGMAVLAADSRHATWDDLEDGDYGPDVAYLDRALARVFKKTRIDPKRIAIAGFADGAGYAVSLAMANCDLFTHVLAFTSRVVTPADASACAPIRIVQGTSERAVRDALGWVGGMIKT